ncbi:MAG: tRNA (adenosine(37)-N6)-threonylcarbamoyltransferase complex dimerization subunit type 1 TsaB [Alphaproteobacteria bacterium]
MNVLALDTATAACSVALWGSGALRARRFAAMTRGHAEALMPMVEETMAEAGLAYADLDAVAATVGPGTFTGLRVGLAAARGLALAAGLPVLGVTTLEALAHGLAPGACAGRSVVAALDARRGEVYVQQFDAARVPLGPPQTAVPAAAAAALPAGPVVLVGDSAALVVAALADVRDDVAVAQAPRLPDAATVAGIAARRFAAADAAPPERPPSPLYLRPPGAKVPLRGGAR